MILLMTLLKSQSIVCISCKNYVKFIWKQYFSDQNKRANKTALPKVLYQSALPLHDVCVNSNVYLTYFCRKNVNFSNPGKFDVLPISCFFKVLSILTAVVGSTWLIKLRMAARTWQSARMICCSNLRAADLTLAWKGKENI